MQRDLRQYVAWAKTDVHRRRVDAARALLRRAAAHGRLVVSTSWGKDSVALCDLAIETLGPVDLMHLSSPYELPGNADIVAYFMAKTVVHQVEAKKTLVEYVDWLRSIGLVHERETNGRAGVRLKTGRAGDWIRGAGYNAQALGLRAEESKARRALVDNKGAIYARKDGLLVVHPLARWETRDVWAYTVERGLPWHPLYDCETHGMTRETLRNAGWLTTMGAGTGRIAWLRRHYPEQYRMLREHFPQIVRLG